MLPKFKGRQVNSTCPVWIQTAIIFTPAGHAGHILLQHGNI